MSTKTEDDLPVWFKALMKTLLLAAVGVVVVCIALVLITLAIALTYSVITSIFGWVE